MTTIDDVSPSHTVEYYYRPCWSGAGWCRPRLDASLGYANYVVPQLDGLRVELERRQARIDELEQQLVRVRQTASESEVLISRLRVELHQLSERPAPRPAVEVPPPSPLAYSPHSLTCLGSIVVLLAIESLPSMKVHEMTALRAKLTHALEQLQAERSQTARLTETIAVLRSEIEVSKTSVQVNITQEVCNTLL